MNFWRAFLGFTLMMAGPASSALVYYELTLTTDAPYTAFGGGTSGDIFTGTFGFDESLLGGTGPIWQTELANNDFFLHVGINATEFSTTTPGASPNNGLLFDGGTLVDVIFDIITPNGDQIEVTTDSVINPFKTVWEATQASDSETAKGTTYPVSVQFAETSIPEPSSWTLGVLGTLALLLRRRRP